MHKVNDESLQSHLEELKKKHRKLDEEIQEEYNHFAPSETLNRLKTKKLWFKDEIHRIETQLGLL